MVVKIIEAGSGWRIDPKPNGSGAGDLKKSL